MPGYTNMQRALRILLAHWLLMHFWPLERDRARLADCAKRVAVLPLGAAALAGTPLDIDREELARDLGFAAPSPNSLDAVSDRDFAAEFLFTAALTGVHLSRLAEQMIVFSSAEFGFVRLDDAYSTGSSIMPQKKNPDTLELTRGKSGRLIGHLTGFLATLKGLPSAYDKDLQEDKPALFDALDTLESSLGIAALLVRSARFDAERCRAQALQGQANATDLAEWLVRLGIPFRDAHERAGAVVRAALEAEVELADLPGPIRARILPELARLSEEEWRRELSIEAVLERRSVLGGTAPRAVRAEINAWKERLSAWKQSP